VALGIVALVVSSVFFYFGGGLIVFFVSVEVSFFFSFDCTWLFLYQYMPGNALVNGFSKKKKIDTSASSRGDEVTYAFSSSW
jgi:hypothetical protein